jgi:hypothetical protein
MQIGYNSVLVGIGVISGQIIAGSVAAQIGKQKWQCVVAFLVGGTFLGCKSLLSWNQNFVAESRRCRGWHA